MCSLFSDIMNLKKMVPRQQLCTRSINVEWSSLKIKPWMEFLQYLKKQAEGREGAEVGKT